MRDVRIPSFPPSHPVIPAKAGIQTISTKPAARNQAQIASDKSLQIRAPSFPPSHPVIPAKAGIQTIEAKPATRSQVRIASDKSLPH